MRPPPSAPDRFDGGSSALPPHPARRPRVLHAGGVLRRAVMAALLVAATAARAGTAQPIADDARLEARMLGLASELRCLVCQNQTLADSHSGLAEDLRRELRTLLRRGASDDDVRRYMTDRYGDFVLYRPPLKPVTVLLWSGPALLLAVAVAVLAASLRRRARLEPARFEADADDPGEPR